MTIGAHGSGSAQETGAVAGGAVGSGAYERLNEARVEFSESSDGLRHALYFLEI